MLYIMGNLNLVKLDAMLVHQTCEANKSSSDFEEAGCTVQFLVYLNGNLSRLYIYLGGRWAEGE